MPIYGYQRAVVEPEFGLIELREISFDFSPADLRRLAEFLQHYAERFEAGDCRSDHAHIGEYDPQWRSDHADLDLIVLRPPTLESLPEGGS